jgi:glycosyltransferase involved in cell wall biosynthesis
VNFYDIFPLTNGGQLSVLGLCKGLSEYFDVTLVMFCGADVYKGTIPVSENLVIIPIDRPRELVRQEALFARGMGLPHTSPITADTLWPANDHMVRRLRKIGDDADILLVDHPYTYQIAKTACPDKIFWHRANNVEADFMAAEYAGYGKCMQLIEMVKNIEEKCCSGCDFVFTVTEQDKRKLCKIYHLPDDKVANISVGSDVESADFILPSARNGEITKILYLSGNYSAAREAAERIVEAAIKLPQFDFYIAGLICSADAFQNRELPKNVHLLWVVSENAKIELLKTCELALNPVLGGAGINMKLLEDFAYGIPVLTTTHGARGLNVTDSSEVIFEKHGDLSADIADFFSTNMEFRDYIARNARALAEREWTWVSVANRVIDTSGIDMTGVIPIKQHIQPFAIEKNTNLKNKTVFMWGAGEQGKFCLNEIRNRGVRIVRIIDSNIEKQGNTFEDILVEAPESLYSTENAVCVISVGALTDAIEIYRTVLENGIQADDIIIARGPLFNPRYLDNSKLKNE